MKADGKTPADYGYNVAVTKSVVDLAHWVGASVEGELGVLGSLETGEGEKEDGHGAEGKLSHDQLLTDPAQAADFVAKTKVDALAIAMGTSHGAYKFTRKPDGAILAMNVVEEIHRRLPNTHLVMHGSSSVPQELQDAFNAAGGQMPQTWGVPVEEIQRGIKFGVRKINIDTDCRIAMTAAIRDTLGKNKRRIRSAQISKARAGSDAQDLRATLPGVWRGGTGVEDQGHTAQRDGQAICGRQARSADCRGVRRGGPSLRMARRGSVISEQGLWIPTLS